MELKCQICSSFLLHKTSSSTFACKISPNYARISTAQRYWTRNALSSEIGVWPGQYLLKLQLPEPLAQIKINFCVKNWKSSRNWSRNIYGQILLNYSGVSAEAEVALPHVYKWTLLFIQILRNMRAHKNFPNCISNNDFSEMFVIVEKASLTFIWNSAAVISPKARPEHTIRHRRALIST